MIKYQRPDGVTVDIGCDEAILVERDGGDFVLTRFENGQAIEIYRPVNSVEAAAVDAVTAILGFRLSPVPRRSSIPFGQIRTEPFQDPAASNGKTATVEPNYENNTAALRRFMQEHGLTPQQLHVLAKTLLTAWHVEKIQGELSRSGPGLQEAAQDPDYSDNARREASVIGQVAKNSAAKNDTQSGYDLNLLERLYLGIMSLKAYIDQMPPDNPVTWIGDRKKKVQSLPDYELAAQVMRDARRILAACLNRY